MTSMELISQCLDEYNDKFYFCSNEDHIQRWASQFNEPQFVIDEFAHILSKSFITRNAEEIFFSKVITSEGFLKDVGDLSDVTIVQWQQPGKSQDYYAKKLQALFLQTMKILIPINDYSKGTFIYIDDFIFSGGTVRHDVLRNSYLINTKKIIFIFLGIHSSGESYFAKFLNKQNLNFNIWRVKTIDNYNSSINNSDVYWPVCWNQQNVQNNLQMSAYLKLLSASGYPPQWRYPNTNVGKNYLFSSSDNRIKIENEFLIAGLKIINQTNTNIQPLGYSPFIGFGFGATVITYRNIPNNAPLCIWWENPGNQGGLGNWYPLMRRR